MGRGVADNRSDVNNTRHEMIIITWGSCASHSRSLSPQGIKLIWLICLPGHLLHNRTPTPSSPTFNLSFLPSPECSFSLFFRPLLSLSNGGGHARATENKAALPLLYLPSPPPPLSPSPPRPLPLRPHIIKLLPPVIPASSPPSLFNSVHCSLFCRSLCLGCPKKKNAAQFSLS